MHELLSFLSDVRQVSGTAARLDRTATYHDACSGLRELGIRAQPRALLGQVDGLRLIEIPGADACCGIGGAYCSRDAGVSDAIAGEKTRRIEASGADMLLAGELGCLMNMAGRLQRLGKPVQARHVAEVLAGVTEPAIGER